MYSTPVGADTALHCTSNCLLPVRLTGFGRDFYQIEARLYKVLPCPLCVLCILLENVKLKFKTAK